MHIDNWSRKLAEHLIAREHLYLQALPREDRSLAKLERLEDDGYMTVQWQVTRAVDFDCNDLHNQSWNLTDFLNYTRNGQPIFSTTHDNCTCQLRVTGPELPEVVVDSY